jgi:NAD+ synthase
MEKTKVNATTGNTMTPKQRIKYITKWIKDYAKQNKIKNLTVGISGGIDSSVVSTLCALTGLPVDVYSMPIHQSKHTHSLSQRHGEWLESKFDNVNFETINLTPAFKQFEKLWAKQDPLALANSRSCLRMMTLYHCAQGSQGIVVGTGNKVEDFGVGFFTKYGDGGVDISPIGDCLKTEVWAMKRKLNILDDIINAAPTDGLWDDQRTDEDQIGMPYSELERMMALDILDRADVPEIIGQNLSSADKKKLKRYRELRNRNLHKMNPIPVCMMPKGDTK